MTIQKKLTAVTAASVLAMSSLLAAVPALAAPDSPAKGQGNGNGWGKGGNPKNAQEVSLQILGTSDLHTNFVNYDYSQDKISNALGLAKTGVVIEQSREENSNTLLFDNGDLIQGTPFGGYKVTQDPLGEDELHPAYAALESLDFDASTLGNHEFNFGLD